MSDLTGPGIVPQTLRTDIDAFYKNAKGRQPTALKEPSYVSSKNSTAIKKFKKIFVSPSPEKGLRLSQQKAST